MITARASLPLSERPLEVVERKGLGHPDTLCELLTETVAQALARIYLKQWGHAGEFDLRSSCLLPGRSTPAFGGGEVLAPMRYLLAGKACTEWGGRKLDIPEVAYEAIDTWLRGNLRFVRPGQHLLPECALQLHSRRADAPFPRTATRADESVVAIGWAPETEAERVVLSAESWLNSAETKDRYPAIGEDIRVLGVRRNRVLDLSITTALVDRFLNSESEVTELVQELERELVEHLSSNLRSVEELHLKFDELSSEEQLGWHSNLTVLGTMAEAQAGGALGRGNRLSGLHSYQRTWGPGAFLKSTAHATACRLYNQSAQQCARLLYDSIAGLEEVQVLLACRKGQELHEPWAKHVKLVLAEGLELADVHDQVEAFVERHLQLLPMASARL